VTILLYSRTAVVITLVYVWLPFVALPIYATMLRIDRRLLEAASNLGAPPATAFRRVTLPLSLPGVAAAFLMVFIPTVGEYVAPLLVGGSQGALYGNIIEIFFGDGINWPLGSALAMVMAVGILALLFVLTRTRPVRRLLDDL
jgi:spermidine/putrescine transport system permease protein